MSGRPGGRGADQAPGADQVHVEDELTALQDGALDPAARDRVEAHLVGCGECRAAAARIRSAIAALSHLPPALPSPGFEQRFHARLARERDAGPDRSGLSRLLSWRFLAPLCVAGAAAALVVVLDVGDGGQQLRMAERLELLESYEVVASLGDVALEDAELVAHLDELWRRP